MRGNMIQTREYVWPGIQTTNTTFVPNRTKASERAFPGLPLAGAFGEPMPHDTVYDYGPPPLTDAELAHLDSIFQHSHPEMLGLLLTLRDPRASESEREIATKRIAEIRGEASAR